MSPSALRLPQRASAEHIWKTFDTFLFDADGVLWREQNTLDGAVELVQKLVAAGKRVLVVTNNSTRDSNEHATKLAKMNFKGLTAENVICSGEVLVHHLKKLKCETGNATTAHLPVYLFGSTALQSLLKRNGIESFGPGPDILPTEEEFRFDSAHQHISAEPVFAVVSAFDAHISYPKIVKAVNYLANPSLPFLATNEDAVFPGPEPGMLIPGAGIVSSVLRYVSGREPLVMGKPGHLCWEYICERFPGQMKPEKTLMIGDRCDTDILFGHNNNITTLLVLTGVNSLEDVERFAGQGKDSLVPDFFVPTLANLIP